MTAERTDLAALRALAEAAQRAGPPAVRTLDRDAFDSACSPDRILALIAEVEDRRGTVARIRAKLEHRFSFLLAMGGTIGAADVLAILDREEARHAH